MTTSAFFSRTAFIRWHTVTAPSWIDSPTKVLLDQEDDEEDEDLEENTAGEDEAEEEESDPTPPAEETQEDRRARVYKEFLEWGAGEELARMAAELE